MSVTPHRALLASCAILVAYWVGFAAVRLSASGPPILPDHIVDLFVRKLVEAIVLAVVTVLLLRTTRERPADLGLAARDLPRSILLGLGWAAARFVVINVGLNSVLASLLGGSVDSVTRTHFRDRSEAPWWIGTALVGGGFAEEWFRVFALTRFEKLLGRGGLVAALVVDSLVFGIGHLYQGRPGATSRR